MSVTGTSRKAGLPEEDRAFQFRQPPEPVRNGSRLAVSLLLHLVAAAVMFSIRPTAELAVLATPRHVVLIAPSLAPAPVERPAPEPQRARRANPKKVAARNIPTPPLPPPPLKAAPRIFIAPPSRASAVPAISTATPKLVSPVEVALESKPALAAPELPRLAGPPIRTGVLDDARVAAPALAVRAKQAQSGFNATASPEAPAVASAKAAARTGGFGDASTARPTVKQDRAGQGDGSAIEILAKPRPAYTAEARRLRIEGEVLLEALFRASGEIQVLRLVRGLGHGLDESASEAARHIRFRPATRDGAAVDSSAIVHISFELAF